MSTTGAVYFLACFEMRFSCRASKICIAEGSEAKGGNRIWWLSRGSANELSCTSKNVKYLLNK